MNQSDAAAKCDMEGAKLVTIQTEEEDNFLGGLFDKARDDGNSTKIAANQWITLKRQMICRRPTLSFSKSSTAKTARRAPNFPIHHHSHKKQNQAHYPQSTVPRHTIHYRRSPGTISTIEVPTAHMVPSIVDSKPAWAD